MLLTIDKKIELGRTKMFPSQEFCLFSSRSEFSVGKNQLGSFSIKLFEKIGMLKKCSFGWKCGCCCFFTVSIADVVAAASRGQTFIFAPLVKLVPFHDSKVKQH